MDIIKQIEELVRENEELKRQNKELREQLRTIENSSDEHEPRYFVYSSMSIHKKFHKPSCSKWAAKISPSNLLKFSSHQEAEAAGYTPCLHCKA